MRVLLLAAALSVFPVAAHAQAQSQSCPVTFTSAEYDPHPPLPVPEPDATTHDKSYGTLAFHYQNASGKAVRAFHVTAHFAPPGGMRPPLLKDNSEDTQHFVQSDPLAANDGSSATYEVRHEVGRLMWLRLDTVEFQDGGLWQWVENSGEGQCTLYPKAALVPAKR